MESPAAGRPEAAALIWEWRGASESSAAEDPARRARLRGALQGVGAGAVGALLFAFWSTVVGALVSTLAAVILLSALVSPTGLYAGVERAFRALGRATGLVITWVLMVALFYLFFVPFGALFRRGRRDSMRRFYDPRAASYWSGRERGRSASASRQRQY